MAKDDRRREVGLDSHEYALLAAFRCALRGFMHFSESAAKGVGLTAQQYQALLAVRGRPAEHQVTINDRAQQLLIRHNTTVGLVDRLDKQGLVTRQPSPVDGRQVHSRLTAKGERKLELLASVHREELPRIGPQLKQLLQQITRAIEKYPYRIEFDPPNHGCGGNSPIELPGRKQHMDISYGAPWRTSPGLRR